MFETVAEFMQKPVKKYACGKKAQEAKKTLMRAFTASKKRSAAKESALFGQIVDSVMKTKTGRETMTALSGLGYSFVFERVPSLDGYCNPENKKIVLNPSSSLPNMMQTLVHEGTHAVQRSLKKENAPEYWEMNAASMLRCRRAIEADAVAHETAFAYECKNVVPEVYRDAEKQNTPMFRAYVGEMEKSGDEKKAMRASFAAWYEHDSYRKSYDLLHACDVRSFCEWGKRQEVGGLFSKEYPAGDVLKMCLYNGKPYMTPDFLNKGLAFSIPAEDKKSLCDALQDYAKALGEKPDRSLSAMRIRTAEGVLLPEKKAVKAAVIAKTKQAGR